MSNNPVGWFEIYVADMSRAKAFYENTLNVKLENLPMPETEMYAFPMNPESTGSSGALVKIDGAPVGKNSTLVYFSCEDCAVESERVIKNGGKIQKEKMSIDQYGFIALAIDTEGNMFGLHSNQ